MSKPSPKALPTSSPRAPPAKAFTNFTTTFAVSATDQLTSADYSPPAVHASAKSRPIWVSTTSPTSPDAPHDRQPLTAPVRSAGRARPAFASPPADWPGIVQSSAFATACLAFSGRLDFAIMPSDDPSARTGTAGGRLHGTRTRPQKPADPHGLAGNGSTRPLQNGDRLTCDEFERRYGAMPELKKAELIEGEVYVSSPVSLCGLRTTTRQRSPRQLQPRRREKAVKTLPPDSQHGAAMAKVLAQILQPVPIRHQ
jgi:hypothetical protein